MADLVLSNGGVRTGLPCNEFPGSTDVIGEIGCRIDDPSSRGSVAQNLECRECGYYMYAEREPGDLKVVGRTAFASVGKVHSHHRPAPAIGTRSVHSAGQRSLSRSQMKGS